MVPVLEQRLSSAGKVTTGLAESDDSLQPEMTQKVSYRLTACTPGSAPGPALNNEYGRTLLLPSYL